MYVMQNTLKNLGRNKGKNILLGIIVFSRIVTTVVTMAISRATSAVIAEYKQQFDSEVSFKMNPTKASSAMEYRSMGNEELLTLGQSDTLQKTQWTAIVCGKPEGLKALDEDTENGYSISGPIGESGEPSTGEITVIVYASDRSDISDDFKTGIREIVDDLVYEKAGECIVSQPFAELNSLSVGDKFTVNDDTGIPCELTVSGIFRDDSMTGDNTPTIYNFVQMPTTNRYNEILTGFNTYTDTARSGGGSCRCGKNISDHCAGTRLRIADSGIHSCHAGTEIRNRRAACHGYEKKPKSQQGLLPKCWL